MAFSSAQKSRAILGDFAVSAFVKKGGPQLAVGMYDATVWTSVARDRQPGLQDGKIALAGLLDTDATVTGQHRQMFDMLGVSAEDSFSHAPQGFTRGNSVLFGVAREESYPIDSPIDDLVGWTLNLQTDGRFYLTGISLADLAAITVDTNGTGVDNAASSANGGAGVLHVTAYSGFTNVVFKVQHSTDNISFVDLVTFTTVTAKTSEVKTVAGTVNRYLRFFADVTGAGSVTCQMSFARL